MPQLSQRATLAVWLARNHAIEPVLPFVLFMGAAMSVTAFPVRAVILTHRGMHRTAVGGLALTCAAVDDVIAWSLLAVVVTVGGSGADQWHVIFAVPYVFHMHVVVRPLLRRLADAHSEVGRLTPNTAAGAPGVGDGSASAAATTSMRHCRSPRSSPRHVA